MNKSDVRYLIASIFSDKISSYSHKRRAAFIYRFETKNCTETMLLLRNLELYKKNYPKEVIYFQSYGVDGFDTGGSIIHLGLRGHLIYNLSKSIKFTIL